ncbi:hypothetical protein [Aliivibrio fischeri]|uniref:hypothetical protein n=1 Tax=Aliivibrio fischeri TaxID=668 RepID=UPI00105B9E43|nr:hypothetical protein [Aliivibrio fischeri]TDM51425.1 hypothetical protein VFFQA001_14990 [Aliivibrio fischeri]
MSTKISDSHPFFKEIINLIQAHDNEDYFKVVMLSPQLLVQIADAIGKVAEEVTYCIVGDCLSEEDKEVYKLIGKLDRDLSDKAYIGHGLVSYYESEYWPKNSSKKEFIKYFTKLEDLVALRNVFAHEFYKKEIVDRRMKNCSKAGIDLILLFASHEYLHDYFEESA